MALHNPHREYDKGMDDAYFGIAPQSINVQYMQGYNRSLQLDEEEQRKIEEKAQYDAMMKEWGNMQYIQK